MSLLTDGFHFLLIILGFGLLIFVHELGHFLAAKWAGIRTEAFAIGFGRPIVSWRKGIGWVMGSTTGKVFDKTGRSPRDLTDEDMERTGIGETEYSIRWLPLGGFVRMLGQDDLAPSYSSDNKRSFNATAIWKRMIVVGAGVTMNLIFAAVLFVIAFSVGVQFEAPLVGLVSPGLPAALARGEGAAQGQVGLRSGDEIVTLDGEAISTFADAQIGIAMAVPDEPISMTVRRDGVDLTFSMLPIKRNGLLSIGITPASSTQLGGAEDEDDAALIASFLKGTDLWDAGLRPGMQVLTADGQPVNSLGQFQDIMTASGGGVVATTWSQPGESDQTDATGVVQVNLTAAPNWSLMRSPGSGDVDPGLLGLTPLVLINNVIAGGANEGVLLPGDVVLRFADIEAPRRGQFLRAISERGSGPVEMTLLRDGKVTTVEANIRSTGVFKPRPMLGINPGEAWDVMRVAQPILVVECDSQGDGTLEPVATAIGDANIQGGSLLRAIDGEPVRDWQAFFNAIDDRVKAGVSSVALTFENPTPGREARTIEVALTDTACAGLAQMSYRSDIPTGAFEPIYTIRNSGGNPLVAIQMGVNETINLITLTYLTIDRVFRGSLGVDQLQGPVGIVHIGTRIANRGFTFLLFFLALISVNLAVVNFLPIPIVDGGLFLNLIYEKIKGRPPSPGFQNAAAILGLVLIGGVFIMVTYNDLVRLVG